MREQDDVARVPPDDAHPLVDAVEAVLADEHLVGVRVRLRVGVGVRARVGVGVGVGVRVRVSSTLSLPALLLPEARSSLSRAKPKECRLGSIERALPRCMVADEAEP